MDVDNMPVITLEVMSECSNQTVDEVTIENLENDEKEELDPETEQLQTIEEPEVKSRHELMEYVTRNDGSVVCKWCGEILQSRTHWYRHKYKQHAPLSPASLFQCEQCLVYFKSRKGYIGHLSSRHSDVLSDTNVISANSPEEPPIEHFPEESSKSKPLDPELAIPKSTVPNFNAVLKTTRSSSDVIKKNRRTSKEEQVVHREDRDKRRTREEKLVADIIDRVRRECEAQGPDAPARRGYSRRRTVMHT